MARETITLPLFPLDSVLFPGMRLALSVYEDRYRRIVQECLNDDLPMGVVLWRNHRDPAAASEPCTVGTTARIVQSQGIDEGRLSVTVVGIGRFSLLSYRQGAKVLIGQARFLPDVDDQPNRLLVDESYALASEYHSLTDPVGARQPVPVDPEALSYWIAQRLPLSLADQQGLLEQRHPSQRLAQEVSWLRERLDAARAPRVR